MIERHTPRDETWVYQPLELFVPNSAGDSDSLLRLTLQAAHQAFPFLVSLLNVVGGRKLRHIGLNEFPVSAEGRLAAAHLEALFNRYGSDKAASRDYHLFYGEVLKTPGAVTAVLEFGLGTNDPAIVSNMGKTGIPGASLRAFEAYLPEALIVGADIDKKVLFETDRIRTFFADQTNLTTLDLLASQVPSFFDLIIDDGLHAPNANLAVVIFGLKRLKAGGWLVIEDVSRRAVPFWEVVAAMLPTTYECWLVRCKAGPLVAIQLLVQS